MHIGIRGPLYDRTDLADTERLGFTTISCVEIEELGVAGTVVRMRERLGRQSVYISIDIDVRGIAGLQVVSADIVEVSPAYDHAEITGIAAAHVAYELLSVMAPPHGGE